MSKAAQAFGLDIGTTSMKAVSLKKTGEKYEVDFIAVAPANEKLILSESPVDQQKLAGQIRKMLDDAGVKMNLVNISLPENQTYSKIIEMPAISEKELASALKWEMEQYIPLPLDQVRTDYQILAESANGNTKTITVFIVAAPTTLIDRYEKVLEMASLTPATIETEVISVLRSLLPQVNTPEASMIVNLGASMTNIAIVKGGVLKTVFSVDLGGLAITRAISTDLGISMPEAENYKKAYGLNQEAFEGKIGRALNPILESIAGDIKKAIFSYKEKNQNEDVSQIVLSGGTSLLPGIDVFFTNTLNTQVVVGRCFNAYDVSNVPQEILYDAPSYNVVTGLALRDFFD